eukprot:gene14145-16729_t
MAEHLKQALEAGNWLEDFQHSRDAWQVSDQLLHHPESTNEIQFFCAQTLKKKATNDFEELPPGAATGLRDSILAVLMRFAQDVPVRKQLSLALVALAAHMQPDGWDNIGAVQWLAQRLGAQPPEVSLPCLLELLVILPQECEGYPSQRPERRRQFYGELLQSTPDALTLLTQCLTNATGMEKVRMLVIEAFGSWVRLSAGNDMDQSNPLRNQRTLPDAATLATHPLVAATLEGLNNPEMFDVCVEASCELIRSTVSSLDSEAIEPSQEAGDDGEAGVGMPGAVEPPNADDEESAKGMARLFAEVGEAYVGLISTGAPEVGAPVEALLETGQGVDLLPQLFTLLTTSMEDPEASAAATLALKHLCDGCASSLTGYMDGLMQIHARALVTGAEGNPTGGTQPLANEDVLQVLEGVVLVVAALPPQQLQHGLHAILAPTGTSVSPSCRCLRHSQLAQATAANSVPRLTMTAGSLLNTFNAWLQGSDIILLNTLNAWLQASDIPMEELERRRVFFTPAFQRLIQSIQHRVRFPEGFDTWPRHEKADFKRNRYSVADTLLDAARVCGGEKSLQLIVQPLSELSQKVASGEAFNWVEAEAALYCARSIARAAPSAGHPTLLQLLASLCTMPRYTQLQYTACLCLQAYTLWFADTLKVPKSDDMSGSDPRLEMLEQATADAFGKLWPLVERAISCTGDDERLAEGLCRVIKYSLRSSRRDQLREKPHRMVAVLPALSAVLRRSFASHRHPSYLFACSECVRAFADHPDAAVKAELQGLLTCMFGDATSRLQRLEDVHNSPDVADDVFLLALKSMKEDCRHVVLNPPVLPALVDCAVTGMLVM